MQQEVTERIECRGLRCPAPVLETARAARRLQDTGGVLVVVADDEAFPVDIRSWCRSAKAELMSIDEDSGTYHARIRLPTRRVSGAPPAPRASAAPSAPTAPRASSAPVAAPRISSAPEAETEQLDCRGLPCPEPILRVARTMRERMPTYLTILATDPAFPTDLKSWCQSAGATLVELKELGGEFRAVVRSGRAARAPASPKQPAGADDVRDSAPPPPPTLEIPLASGASEGVSVNLTRLSRERLAEQVSAMVGGLGADLSVAFEVADAVAAQAVVRWAVGAGHQLLSMTPGTPSRVEIVTRASAAAPAGLAPALGQTTSLVVRPDDAVDCAILVLHDDFEALFAALMMANAAAAQGMKVMVFFAFWGLNLLRGDRPNPAFAPEPVGLLQRMFKLMMPRAIRSPQLSKLNFLGIGARLMRSIMRTQKVSDLPQLVESAQEQGVTFAVCTLSMNVMGIRKRDLHPYRHLEYVGAATFMERSGHARSTMVF